MQCSPALHGLHACGDQSCGCQQDAVSCVEPVEGPSHRYVAPLQHVAAAWAAGPSYGQRSRAPDRMICTNSADSVLQNLKTPLY